jgi:hypothetical protein
MTMEYFYAAQLRQYRLQIIRAFSNFSVSVGTNPDGSPRLRRVPCRYGDSSRLAEMIIVGNSENKAPSAPFISVYVTGMNLAPERRAAPSLVSTLNVNERAYDSEQGKYLNSSGNRYTVKRYMPVPFTMEVNVDFWTSSLQQKEELFEQTQVLFNGMIDIQTSVNPIDWTLFSTIEPTNITWSSRSIPVGTDNPIDVMTVTYRIPIWINPPAQVTYQRLIEQVVTNIGNLDAAVETDWNSRNLFSRIIVTPDNAHISLRGSQDNVYEISLTDAGGLIQDTERRPTKIAGARPPMLTPGSSFLLNGTNITVPNGNIQDLLTVMVQNLQSRNTSASLLLNNTLQIVRWDGGDIVFENVVGTPVQDLGFLPTVYPGGRLSWWRLLDYYGAIDHQNFCANKNSLLKVLTSSNLDDRTGDIVGTIQLHPVDPNLLLWTVDTDTWPATTMTPISAVINPTTVWPGNGLPAAQQGQRYLITDDIADGSAAWGPISAVANNIIEFDGSRWISVFDASERDDFQLIQNTFSQKFYKFDQGGWELYPPPRLGPGLWRLEL